MPIRVSCPNCRAKYRVADKTAGQSATCVQCHAQIPIPLHEAVGVGGKRERIAISEKVTLRRGAGVVRQEASTVLAAVTDRVEKPLREVQERVTPVFKPDPNAVSESDSVPLAAAHSDQVHARRTTEATLTKVLLANMTVNVVLAVALAVVVYRAVPSALTEREGRPSSFAMPPQSVLRSPPIAEEGARTPITLKEPVPAAAPKRLMGSGSSFVNPMMQTWLADYPPRDGVSVSYLSTGSGKGVDNLLSKNSHFACSDAPMTAAQLETARSRGGEVVHLPLAMGAVVAGYNLPGEPQLRFTGPLLADIYLGKIKRWNDPAIAALNAGVMLPDQPIIVVQRSDKSGTTFLWTDYLAKVSPDWKSQVGVGTEVKWPCGEGRPQNEGVANYVRRTVGAIGYFEMGFAKANRLQIGVLQNRAGKFIESSLESTTAAAAGLTHLPEDLCFSLTDSEGPDAYPICGAVWAILFVEQPPGQGEELVHFLRWVTHEGQARCGDLNYASLPEAVVRQIERKLTLIRIR